MLGQTVSDLCAGSRSLSVCREHRRRRLRMCKNVHRGMRTAAMARCKLDWRFPEDHQYFFELGWLLFFLFHLFSFFVFFRFPSPLPFFFWTRLLTLCNLRYVATRLNYNNDLQTTLWVTQEVNFCSLNTISWMKTLIVETFKTNKTSLCHP